MIIDNVVLGAGIAGIAAAWTARRRGEHVTVFEARSTAGGLLDNFIIEGFRFDTAVHLSFASEPEVREVFDRTPYLTHSPEALCWDDGLWLKHPTQNNMYPLPMEQKVELIAGLAEHSEIVINNYRDWLIYQYGEPIATRWPLVYTEKYWTISAECLGTDWIGQRMRRADLREVLTGAFTSETPNGYYVKEMRYPKNGGYRAFIEPMIAEIDIAYDHRVEAVDHIHKTIRFSDDRTIEYRNLVSTLPLPRLVEMMPNVTRDVRDAAASLYATEIDLISIGFDKREIAPALWFYIYDRDIHAARGYSPSRKSPSNAPDGCSSLQFEIYSSRARPQTHSSGELKDNTVKSLNKMGISDGSDILFVDHRRLPYGNVVFDLGMEARRDRVCRWVARQGIHSAGRFGEWEYFWSNQSMMSGMRAAERAFGLAPLDGLGN